MRLDGKKSSNSRNVLLICPDAHQTEAVGQALALVRIWSSEYRVHVMLLSPEGPLLNAFRSHAVAVWIPDQSTDSEKFSYVTIKAILADNALIFAVIISVAARTALASLERLNVPSLAFVSEMASMCSPINAMSETIAGADQVVMPAQVILDDAMATDYLLSPGLNIHVVPPGDCDFSLERPIIEAEATRLRAFLRPEGIGPRRFIILGAGPVTFANGVDVFLEIARNVLERREGQNALFVWTGPGFDPRDGGYGAHLFAQLRGTELESHVLFLPETPDMGALYQSADLFVIPARTDPMSSNGIAALRAGLPTLCFAGASSLAEYLTDAGLAPTCVAKYLNIAELADQITALAVVPDRCAFLGARSAFMAAHYFNPLTQASTIATLAAEGRRETEADMATICDSPTFNPEFYLGSDVGDRRTAALKYLKGMRTGIAVRKPEPGFHPLMFAQAKSCVSNRDPYAEFLRLGRPLGPWCVPVITSKADTSIAAISQTPLRAALQIHAYFPNQLIDIMTRLACNVAQPDLYISVTNAEGHLAAKRALKNYCGTVRAIEVVPNVGRNIGPFLTAFGDQLVRGYDVVGHVHTKQSDHILDAEIVRRWVDLTLSGVLGGQRTGPMMDCVLRSFTMNDKLGIVYPDDPHVFGWTANTLPARRFLATMGKGPIPDAINFPVGSMFWMRAAALQPFVDLGLTWDTYPTEPLATDGTSLHALERLFGVVPGLDGWETAVTFTPSIGR